MKDVAQNNKGVFFFVCFVRYIRCKFIRKYVSRERVYMS